MQKYPQSLCKAGRTLTGNYLLYVQMIVVRETDSAASFLEEAQDS
jgi:hypothetical protein